MNILLIDIDHTISDAAWRDDMIGSNTDWYAYHLAGKEDKPIQETIELINSCFSVNWEIVCVTARPEKFREQTMQWFLKHDVQVDRILMRPNDSFKPSPEQKILCLKEEFGDDLQELKGMNVIFIDDNEKVIEAIRGLGITTMQITVGRSK